MLQLVDKNTTLPKKFDTILAINNLKLRAFFGVDFKHFKNTFLE